MKILALTRDPRFSPNSVENDRAILMAVARRLHSQGHEVAVRAETEVAADCDVCLTMGRLPATLAGLKRLQRQGVRVVNTPLSVENCTRSTLTRLMQVHGIPMPPSDLPPFWLKRGDASAQSPADVVYCQDKAALAEAIGRFRARGVAHHVVSSHVVGDVVKFYGVGSDFFRCYYPTDDGQTKFGDEHHNGPAHHYIYNKEEMHSQVVRLAAITGLEVYGGDAIVRPDGTFCIIDFNDWPSFARCRDEAAEAISQLVSKGM